MRLWKRKKLNEENCVLNINGTEDKILNIRITATVKNGNGLMP